MNPLLCVFLLLLLTAPPTTNANSPNEEGLAYLETNKNAEGVVVLPSGLQYKILKKGSGTHHPTRDSPCLCHYEGTLISGEVFDSSYARGDPTTFAPNQVIAGWTEAMQLMVEGDKWELTIPSDLAYGERGSPPKIPGGSTLIFQMEILEIQGKKVEALKCNPETPEENCNDKEQTYIAKMKLKQQAEEEEVVEKELNRLTELLQSAKMKPELMAWITRRVHILKQMVVVQPKKEEEL